MSERTAQALVKSVTGSRTPSFRRAGATTQFPQRVRALNNFLSSPINKFTGSAWAACLETAERARTYLAEYRELTFTDLISTKLSSLTRGASYAS